MSQVKTRDLNWGELCRKAWGKDWTAPEVAYEFTNRKFFDRSMDFSGISVEDGTSVYADNYSDGYA